MYLSVRPIYFWEAFYSKRQTFFSPKSYYWPFPTNLAYCDSLDMMLLFINVPCSFLAFLFWACDWLGKNVDSLKFRRGKKNKRLALCNLMCLDFLNLFFSSPPCLCDMWSCYLNQALTVSSLLGLAFTKKNGPNADPHTLSQSLRILYMLKHSTRQRMVVFFAFFFFFSSILR